MKLDENVLVIGEYNYEELLYFNERNITVIKKI